jgi:hypothetical protein
MAILCPQAMIENRITDSETVPLSLLGRQAKYLVITLEPGVTIRLPACSVAGGCATINSRKPERHSAPRHRLYAAAFFAAHRFFIAIPSALRPAAVSPRFGFAALAGAFAEGVDWPLIFAHLSC